MALPSQAEKTDCGMAQLSSCTAGFNVLNKRYVRTTARNQPIKCLENWMQNEKKLKESKNKNIEVVFILRSSSIWGLLLNLLNEYAKFAFHGIKIQVETPEIIFFGVTLLSQAKKSECGMVQPSSWIAVFNVLNKRYLRTTIWNQGVT